MSVVDTEASYEELSADAPKAAPEEAPELVPEAVAPRSAGVDVRFTGADRVILVREPGGERLALRADGAREVRPGHYKIEARFGEHQFPVGRLTVMAGVDVTLSCDVDFLTCKPR